MPKTHPVLGIFKRFSCHFNMHPTSMDLTEAEDIKKKWQEYTEKLYKKDLHDPDNHNGDHSPTARYPGMRIQVGLRKHHYEQS